MTAVPSTADDKVFFGHPRGLAYIAFTEAWERFSYYGMQTLLVLYMVHQLLLPGHVENVVGLGPLRAILERDHPLSNQQLASAVFGLYTGLVYLTPIFGGFLADRLLGRTRTVVLGASLMAIGHFLMAFDVSFISALVFLMLGVGCFKGNLATQVGSLYAAHDNRRADAFQIYYLGINAGVIVAPFVTGTLGEKVAWHYGFGAAGVGMLISLIVYLSGRKHLPADPPLKKSDPLFDKTPMTGPEWSKVLLLIFLLPVLSASVVGNQEIFNAYLVWVEKAADLHLFGVPILTTWMISVDSIVSVVTLFGMMMFWRMWAKRFKEPDELGKIIIGCVIAAAGVFCLAAGATIAARTGQKVGFGWLLAFHLLNDIGFANILPVGLALYVRSAPKAVAATIVGIYYLHLFAGNLFVGWLGGKLETTPAPAFWMMHVILVGGAGVVLFVVRLLFGKLLLGAPVQPDIATVAVADAGETP